MANNNNRWPSPSQAYTGSNHGDQPQSESGFDRGNGGGRGNGVYEELPVVINNGSNDGNNGNRNEIIFGDGYSNIGGEVAEPVTGDPRYKQWKSENSLIIVWLVSSMETGIGDRSVTAYYNELLTLWQELDLYYDDNWRCTEDNVLFLKRQGNDRVFMFRVGLNKDLDESYDLVNILMSCLNVGCLWLVFCKSCAYGIDCWIRLSLATTGESNKLLLKQGLMMAASRCLNVLSVVLAAVVIIGC
ncbi:hypothetical protein KIW84_036243 [Lathyrus oleraceus]|uniref:Uncharacterized protein n=1 Tax=Pisum sativum TaxID=3888 RepID=A0A9D5B3G8_PEA|nr:hypothetical protein KIW84_036243 [Pisum sativum]